MKELQDLSYLERAGLTPEVVEAFNQVLKDLSVCFASAAEAITEAFRSIVLDLTPTMQSLANLLAQFRREEQLIEEAIKKELVPPRSRSLCYHKRERIAKKNMNRVKKELALYEKRHSAKNNRICERSPSVGSGDSQPEGPV